MAADYESRRNRIMQEMPARLVEELADCLAQEEEDGAFHALCKLIEDIGIQRGSVRRKSEEGSPCAPTNK